MSALTREQRGLALRRLRRLQSEIPQLVVRADVLAESLAAAQQEADALVQILDQTDAPVPDPP